MNTDIGFHDDIRIESIEIERKDNSKLSYIIISQNMNVAKIWA